METKVTRRGQTSIPAAIRRRYGIHAGDRLVWLDEGETIRVVPMSADSLAGLRGAGRGEGLGRRLLEERGRDRRRFS